MREYDLWIDGDYYESAKAHCAADALDKMETLKGCKYPHIHLRTQHHQWNYVRRNNASKIFNANYNYLLEGREQI